jgi:hypothetical protein
VLARIRARLASIPRETHTRKCITLVPSATTAAFIACRAKHDDALVSLAVRTAVRGRRDGIG